MTWRRKSREGRQRLRRRREDVRGREGNTVREIEEQNLCWIFTSELFVQLASYTSLNKQRILSNRVGLQNINTSLHVTPVIIKPLIAHTRVFFNQSKHRIEDSNICLWPWSWFSDLGYQLSTLISVRKKKSYKKIITDQNPDNQDMVIPWKLQGKKRPRIHRNH